MRVCHVRRHSVATVVLFRVLTGSSGQQ